MAPSNSVSSASDLSLFRRFRPRLYAIVLKLLPDLDEGHLVAGVSKPLVHLGELRVEAEVVNVLGVARHRRPLALQPGRIGIVGSDEPGVLTDQLLIPANFL